MNEFLEIATWLVIGKIIIIDILLAGDNAVVIGMAAGKLHADLQKKAIFWGTFGAIALRLLMATVLVEALHIIPALHIIGGLVLLWIAIQLLADSDETKDIKARNSLRGAIVTIVMADAMMSIDNVLAVVAAAQGHLELVIVGMLITVPIIIFSSALFAKIINRFPIILYAGGALLGWVAGEMIIEDALLQPYIAGYEIWIKLLCIIIVLLLASIVKYKNRIGESHD